MSLYRDSLKILLESKQQKTPSPLPPLAKRELSIQTYKSPAFLMNAPFSLSIDNPNNAWMKDAKPEDKVLNKHKAFNEWMEVYNYLSSMSLVYLLPSVDRFQDQVYVANLGIVLPHLKNETVILSNYKSPPRVGEENVGTAFFNMMGYKTVKSPPFFEGEADLKFLKDNVYIGAYGQRTSIEALNFMEKNYDMKIIKLKSKDEYLYHLDCLVFPITKEKVMVCTELVEPKTIKEIEKYSEIIDVSADDAYCGITNSVRCSGVVLCCSTLNSMKATDEHYQDEVHKVASMEKICAENALELAFFDMYEGTKSGAMLSCCILHLNYVDYM